MQKCEAIENTYGIPIVNKRISVTPIAHIASASRCNDLVPFAQILEKAAQTVGVNFLGGFSALVHKGITPGDAALLRSIPEALSVTEHICSSVNIGSTKAGINMDAVKEMGKIIRQTAENTADRGSIGCAKLVVFCNAVEDNPFMAGAFLGSGEGDCVINVGVSGPGVVKCALEKMPDATLGELAEEIKASMFVFDDIVRLEDTAIQRILKEVNVKDIAYALKGASNDVSNAIYRNQSQRAAAALKEEIELLGKTKVSQVEESQQNIVNIIRKLEEIGEITLTRGSDEEFVL